ncbi:MAG TPA: hypothetical protein PK280_11650 [Planctomycetota bacterium]|nr:hypothetical protein [Planctomycetota bacterium]
MSIAKAFEYVVAASAQQLEAIVTDKAGVSFRFKKGMLHPDPKNAKCASLVGFRCSSDGRLYLESTSGGDPRPAKPFTHLVSPSDVVSLTILLAPDFVGANVRKILDGEHVAYE